jgi:hypothetical protein
LCCAQLLTEDPAIRQPVTVSVAIRCLKDDFLENIG